MADIENQGEGAGWYVMHLPCHGGIRAASPPNAITGAVRQYKRPAGLVSFWKGFCTC